MDIKHGLCRASAWLKGKIMAISNNPSQNDITYDPLRDEYISRISGLQASTQQFRDDMAMNSQFGTNQLGTNTIGSGLAGLNSQTVLGATGPVTGTVHHNIATATLKAFDPNTAEACMIPLSRLILLWQTKYGDSWVDRSTTNADPFWAAGTTRLRNANVFEVMEMGRAWCRLKEEYLGNN